MAGPYVGIVNAPGGHYSTPPSTARIYVEPSGSPTGWSTIAEAALQGPAGPTGATGPTGPTGATGATGANGSTWYAGSAAPGSGTGVNGDFYLRTATGDVYQKAAGAWGSPIENLTGPAGATGATGATGPQGPAGLGNPLAAGTLGAPGLQVGESVTGLVGQLAAHTLSVSANGVEACRFGTAASGVNYVIVAPAATGAGPSVLAAGSDTHVDLFIGPKGGSSSTQSRIRFTRSNDSYQFGGITLWDDGDWQFGNTAGSGFKNLRFAGAFTLHGDDLNFGIKDAAASGKWLNVTAADLRLPAASAYGFSPGADSAVSPDTKLSRGSAGVWSVDGGTTGDGLGQIRQASANGSGFATFSCANCPATTLTGPTAWVKETVVIGGTPTQGWRPIYV